MSNKNLEDSLFRAIKEGNIKKINYILALKCDINAVDGKGRNVLGWAGLCGNLEVFKHLVDKGADIYAKDNQLKELQEYVVNKFSSPLPPLSDDEATATAQNAKIALKKGGKIYLEIGIDMGLGVQEIFARHGWEYERSENALGGVERVLVFTLL